MKRDEHIEKLKVTFFGDSIFFAQGVSIYHGWVTRLAKFLDEKSNYLKGKIIVTNTSVNGRTTRQALEDMPYSVQSHAPDILIIQFGLNDCNFWESDRGVPRVSLEAYKANLNEMVERALLFGSKKIFLNNNHPTARNHLISTTLRFSYEESNRRYCDAVADLAVTLPKCVSFQNIYEHFNTVLIDKDEKIEKFLLDDGLHLNELGHQIYFDLMAPKIFDAVKISSSEKS